MASDVLQGQREVMSDKVMPSHRRGVHAIAAFEAGKGLVVLLLSFGILSLLGHDVHHIGVRIAHYLGLDHGHHYSAVFIKLFDDLNDLGIWQMALLAFFYSLIRLVEAYGLWKQKSWAEWFAILSGAVYLPFEAIKMIEHFEWWKVAITVINVVVVAYLIVLKVKHES